MYANTGGVEEPGSTAPDDTKSIELLVPEDVLGVGTGSDILIVDDSDTNLVAYEAALAPLGRKLVLARSGNDALRELLDADFALVLLDFSMPGITGIETARMVRSRPRSRGTPILFISGASPSSEVVLEAFDVGALDFISKPIQPDVLRAKVSVYLRLQERTAQLLKQAAVLRDAHQRLEHAASAERERDAATSTALRLEKLQEITTALGDTRTSSSGSVRWRSARALGGCGSRTPTARCRWQRVTASRIRSWMRGEPHPMPRSPSSV
jgi:CheY-like chemotaxis protein